jgi:glycosyltransferase involved in cell wall biosynthesis
MVHPGAELYGSDRVFLDSARELLRQGWSVTVALPDSGPLVGELEELGISVRRVPGPVLRKSALRPAGMARLVRDSFAFLRPARQLLDEVGPAVVYVSTVTLPLWLLGARAMGHPVLCHVHEAETGIPRWMQRLLAVPLHAADMLVLNSAFSRRVLLESAPRLDRRSSVLLNPVPGPPTVKPARIALDDGPSVLFIGRLSPRKGPQVALSAVEELRRREVPVRLDLLGAVFPGYEWFEESLRREVTRSGLDDQVRFLGFCPDVWPALAAADVVVIPSVADEPFGNAAVEAVLSARPVIASDSGGLVEAVQGYRSAMTVPREDPSALADAIEQITSGWSERRLLAIEDAAVAADRHSLHTYGLALDGLLHAAEARRNRRRTGGRRRTAQDRALRSRYRA